MTKAASDGVLSVSDLMAMTGTAKTTGKSIHTVLSSSKKVMDNVGQDPWKTVPMILVKHRWMKGKSVLTNNTILSFGMDGIARVPNAGNALADVELFVKTSRGLAEIVNLEPNMDLIVTPIIVKKVEETQPVTKNSSLIATSVVAEDPVIVAVDPEVGDDASKEQAPKKSPPRMNKPKKV